MNPPPKPPLSQRSCVNCYKRKLKCDRLLPCNRCSSRGSKCEYPQAPIRRHRVSRTEAGSLKGRITSLEKDVLAIKDSQSNAVTIYAADYSVLKETDLLVVDGKGGSRLLSAIGWANIKEEKDDLSSSLLPVQERASPEPTSSGLLLPIFNQYTPAPRFSPLGDQQVYFPTLARLEAFWEVYCQNVDPVVRILHKPTVCRLLNDVKRLGIDTLTPASHALLLSISFGAVNSVSSQRSEELFGETLETLSSKLGQAVEHTLFRARLSQTHDIVALQAFSLFITCMPPDASRSTWTLIGLAIRIAISMGLHRDGSEFGLSPFEAEMRRRLWWHLLLIDIRTSEDYACNPYSFAGGRVALPLNLDDCDLDPHMREPMQPKQDVTEMTFTLMRYEACLVVLEVIAACDRGNTGPGEELVSKEERIRRFETTIHEKYVRLAADGGHDVARNRLILQMARMAILKMGLIWGFAILRQSTRQGPQDRERDDSTSNRAHLVDDLLNTATELLESQLRLQNDKDFNKWMWILRNYNQWHAVAIVLTQISSRVDKLLQQANTATTSTSILDEPLRRAWTAVKAVFANSGSYGIYGEMWGPLDNIRRKIESKLNEGSAAQQEDPYASGPQFGIMGETFSNTRFTATTSWMDESAAGSSAGETLSDQMFSEPWPLYFPTSFFAGGGL